MNNKYLFEKLEQAHSVKVENILLVAFEFLRSGRPSDVFQEFTELEPKQICEVLGWKKDSEELFKKIEDSIEEGEFSHFMYRNNYDGFIAEIHVPKHDNFRFKKNGEFASCSVHEGICRVEWVYAPSIGELTDKIVEKAEEVFQEYVNEFKEKQSKK